METLASDNVRGAALLKRPGCATPPNLTPAESGLEPWPVFHEVGCAATPSDGAEPGYCDCGVSPRFRLFGYDKDRGHLRWSDQTRERLVYEAVKDGLARSMHYGWGRSEGEFSTPFEVAMRRAVEGFLHAKEYRSIVDRWDRFWTLEGQTEFDGRAYTLHDHGIPDIAAQVNLAPLPEDLRELLQRTPTEAEIKATMQPWLEHWAKKDRADG